MNCSVRFCYECPLSHFASSETIVQSYFLAFFINGTFQGEGLSKH